LFTCIAVAALLCAPATFAATSGVADTGNDYLSNELLIRLNLASDLPAVAAQFGLDPTPIDQLAGRPLYRLRILAGRGLPTDVATAMALDPRVAYAEPNFVGKAPEDGGAMPWASGDAVAYAQQWAPFTLRLLQAWQTTRGSGSTVAVLDTGVDTTHPALIGHLTAGYNFVSNTSDPSEVGQLVVDPVYGHGTHVAGLVALVAPEAKIMPLRVLDQNGVGDVWRLAKALVYAADPFGTGRGGADVINLSLSTLTRTHLLTDLITDLSADGRGIVAVAAAGNLSSSTPMFPAAEGGPGILSVGATTMTDSLASFSNFGSWVKVAAPGDRVTSTMAGHGYATWSGTSMATALASGEAALVRAAFPQLRAGAVVQQMVKTSTAIPGQVPRRLDANAAVSQLVVGGGR
jgi:subtilisin family serine protease